MTRSHLLAVKGCVRNYILGGVEYKRGIQAYPSFVHGVGHFKFSEISAKDISNFLGHLLDTHLSLKSIREVRNALSLVMEQAVLEKYISFNPVRGIKINAGRKKKANRKAYPPEKDLIYTILDLADESFYVYLLFATLTGVRAGEQRGLTWEAIDFNKQSVTVVKSVDAWGDDDEQGPKTEAGNRSIPLSAELVEVLIDWKTKSNHVRPTDLVFPNSEGNPLNHNNIRNRRYFPLYHAAVKEWPADRAVPHRPRWHDLRHFAVSLWIEAGFQPKAIQEFAGHESLSTTMDIYGHLFPSDAHNALMSEIAKSFTKSAVQQHSLRGTSVAQIINSGE